MSFIKLSALKDGIVEGQCNVIGYETVAGSSRCVGTLVAEGDSRGAVLGGGQVQSLGSVLVTFTCCFK